MEFHDEYQKIEGCVINDPLALALTFMPELWYISGIACRSGSFGRNFDGQERS